MTREPETDEELEAAIAERGGSVFSDNVRKFYLIDQHAKAIRLRAKGRSPALLEAWKALAEDTRCCPTCGKPL